MGEFTDQQLSLAARVAELESQLAQQRRYFLQTMLTIAMKAGGEFAIDELDTAATIGYSLHVHVDRQTGATVFTVRGHGQGEVEDHQTPPREH